MGVAESGNPGSEAWVTVGAYANGWEADLALSLLRAEGLPAHLENREFVGMDWTIAAAVGWIKVLAPADVAKAARAVLANMESSGRAGDLHLSEAELTDTETCLRCGARMPVDDEDCDACGWSYGEATDEVREEELTPQQRWNQMQDRKEHRRAVNNKIAWLVGILFVCTLVALIVSWLGLEFLGENGF
ncbi:MAG: hypothetical protein AAGF84_03125 [Planctomycetota bacterium]